MRTVDIYWIAGLIEGEGYIGVASNGNTPTLTLSMTCKDVVEKAYYLFGAHTKLSCRSDKRPNHKDVFTFQISGRKAAAWIMTMFPLFGRKRRKQSVLAMNAFHRAKYNWGRFPPIPKSRRHPDGNPTQVRTGDECLSRSPGAGAYLCLLPAEHAGKHRMESTSWDATPAKTSELIQWSCKCGAAKHSDGCKR